MNSDASDDENPPESLSLSQTKLLAARHESALNHVDSARKRKQKEKNRRRDENLKKRAEETRGKTRSNASAIRRDQGDDGLEEVYSSLEARMVRAMKDAADESDEGEDFGEGPSASESELAANDGLSMLAEDEAPISEGDGEQMDDDASTEGEEFGTGLDDSRRKQAATRAIRRNSEYLPDHVFAAALAQRPITSKEGAHEEKKALVNDDVKRKRRKANRTAKRIVLKYVIFIALNALC